MAYDWYPQFLAEWTALVQAALGLASAQVITTTQAISDDVVQSVRQAAMGDSDVTPLPWGIIQIGLSKNVTDWGLQNDLYREPIAVWLIQKETDLQDVQRQTQMNSLLFNFTVCVRTGTFPSGFTSPISESPQCVTFEQIEDADIDSSEHEPLNQRLRGDSQISVCTGSASWSPGLLVGGVLASNAYP